MLRNPLTMQGQINRCWLFTFRAPEPDVRALLPPEVEPVTHGGWGFWNVVICHIRAMRPHGLPEGVGVSYWHAAYRLYVRCYPEHSAPVEGLYFLRSDCDSPIIAAAGNCLTEFHFHSAVIGATRDRETTRLEIASPDAPAWAVLEREPPTALPAGSPFGGLEEAARALKYKPCGISVPGMGRVNLVRIRRDETAWRSRLVAVRNAEWSFFREREAHPEICYEVDPIEYIWQRGVDCPVRAPRDGAAVAPRDFNRVGGKES